MINEISQNMPGATTLRPRRESGATSSLENAQAVKAPTVSASKGTEVSNAGEQGSTAVEGKQLEEMVEDLNGLAQAVQRQLQFSVDGDNGKVFVKVVDAETKDVIREIPSEEIRNMQKHLREVSEMMFHKGEGTSLLFKGEA